MKGIREHVMMSSFCIKLTTPYTKLKKEKNYFLININSVFSKISRDQTLLIGQHKLMQLAHFAKTKLCTLEIGSE